MKLTPFLFPVFLLTAFGGLVAWLVFAEPPALPAPQPQQPASALRPALEEQTAQETRTAAAQPEDMPPSAAPLPEDIRNVSPDGMSTPRVKGHLKRIAPSERFQELMNPPVEPVPDGPLEFRRVEVLDGGRLKSNQLIIQLAHIEALKIDQVCGDSHGGTWPCGARARTFLQGLTRQFKITCEKLADTGPNKILASCQRGKIDLSTRLVRYGWARPSQEAPEGFQEFTQLAEQRKLGQWKDQWQIAAPRLDWDANPDAALPGLESLEPEIVEWSETAPEPETAQADQSPLDLGRDNAAPYPQE